MLAYGFTFLAACNILMKLRIMCIKVTLLFNRYFRKKSHVIGLTYILVAFSFLTGIYYYWKLTPQFGPIHHVSNKGWESESNFTTEVLLRNFASSETLKTRNRDEKKFKQFIDKSLRSQLVKYCAWKSESDFTTEVILRSFVSSETRKTRNRDEKGRMYILYWRPPWGIMSEGIPEGYDPGGCVYTYNRSKLPDAEVVLFHYTSLDRETMPWKHYRDPDQLFAYFSDESPNVMKWIDGHKRLPKFDDGFINVTVSYRSDSTVFGPYISTPSSLEAIIKEGKQWVDRHLAKKSKIALWLVSNCDLTYGAIERKKYADKLVEAGLPVDRYGKCFKNESSLNKTPIDSYKFYLSFENAIHCKDYITEKFWRNAISLGRVPVVWGPLKKDVVRLAPTYSFIHAEDFDSPASLASYLLYLDKNNTAYREYFKWIENPDDRTRELAKHHNLRWFHQLCDLIKQKERNHSVIQSVTNFYLSEVDECFRGKDKKPTNSSII